MKNFKVISITIAAVVAVSLGLYFFGGVRNYLDARALAKYKKEKETYNSHVVELTQKLAAANARADEAEGRAKAAEAQVPALEAELEKFGAAGRKAVTRQEEAAKVFEADKNRIKTSTDGCQICRDLCAEREKQSTAEFDVRCPTDYCSQFCPP